ncbi:fimbrial protein [Salmonella enterica]|nr:fimbrial protein [Salmonella enterica]EFQ6618139.1 fimbrial protein [Salmonella enterica]
MNNFIKLSLATLLAGGCSSVLHAETNTLATSFNAKIVDNSCRITLSNNGAIALGIVSVDYLKALSPTQYAGGTRFTISVDDCGQSSERQASQLHMRFRPQSGVFSAASKQVFTNDIPAESQGAQDVGVVVFSDRAASSANVLNADGSSDVIYPTSGDGYQGDYSFTARMQQEGNAPAPGQVKATVIVDIYYD